MVKGLLVLTRYTAAGKIHEYSKVVGNSLEARLQMHPRPLVLSCLFHWKGCRALERLLAFIPACSSETTRHGLSGTAIVDNCACAATECSLHFDIAVSQPGQRTACVRRLVQGKAGWPPA